MFRLLNLLLQNRILIIEFNWKNLTSIQKIFIEIVIVKRTIKQYQDEAKTYKFKPSIRVYNKEQLLILDNE